MKVFIGPYITWWGPYQIANLLKYVGVSEDRCHDIGHKLSDSWVGTLCTKIHNKRSRKIKVKIDGYDIWSADHTIALIVAPLLRRLIDARDGAGYTDDDDVPDHLKSINAAEQPKHEGDTDSNFFKRWEYILEEMYWAFNEVANDLPNEPELFRHRKHVAGEEQTHESEVFGGTYEPLGEDAETLHNQYHDRIKNGTRLFGKYYRGLWT